MALRFIGLSFDANEPGRVVRFWAALLDLEIDDDGLTLVPGHDIRFRIQFHPSPREKDGPNRMHIHLTSASLDEQHATVARALGLGARHLDVGQTPEEGHVVLADPEGNEFCVIEPGNRFLAGCGFLGELTCDGSREVGCFWSEALGWPLVWDQDQETAVQSPDGGTKISWGGPPVAPKVGRNRLRFDLAAPVANDPGAEVDRLVSLGATRIGSGADGHGWVELADPDGNEFRVLDPRAEAARGRHAGAG